MINNLLFDNWLLISFVGLIGLLVGSFLNVVIYRTPVMMEREEKLWAWEVIQGEGEKHPDISSEKFNLLFPASHCPNCGHKIRFWENIPVISYLIQGKKCRNCHQPISSRYMWVELLTAFLSMIAAWYFPEPIRLGLALLFTWGLIALTFIDAAHQLLPDRITLPLMWLGIAAAWYGDFFIDLSGSILGAMVGYLSLWSVYWLFKLITGREGMGYGDFKLLACLCAWQGAMMLPIILMIASICGILYALINQIGKGRPMPFGPYLATAGWLTFLFGGKIAAYIGFFPS
ncbi:prepilin peptidase [Suttonella ornithocola]|uniref:Prepilin leader peptidase/N-methyltransferase n=1 Tax=Suttonella ornithocola TaxID=279832 RepID=A0A380MSR4_9GAMM|nr:A24 family peptidase [Suttonella ornithocola]SUO94387.1 Pectic enzymes secretion protein outO [Suttonella ornithocola]